MRKVFAFILLPLLYVSVCGQQAGTKGSKKVEGISLCEVEKNLNEYIGAQLNVDVIYSAGFEMGWLEDVSNCEIERKDRHAIRYTFAKVYEVNTESKVLERMRKELKKKRKDAAKLRRVRGNFQIQVSRYKPANENDVRYEYEITVLKINSISTVKKDNQPRR